MKYFQFAVVLAIIIILGAIAVLSIELYTAHEQTKRLGTRETINSTNSTFDYSLISVKESFNESEYIILDVREPEEYFRNHLHNAINLQHGDIFRNKNTLEYLRSISKNKTFAIYCYENKYTGTGDGRSGTVAQYLIENNISAVVIDGGMKEFSNNKRLITENHEYSMSNMQEYAIEEKKSKCVVNFKNHSEIKTPNEELRFQMAPGYLTTFEWSKIMEIAGNNTCAVKCVDEPTCFYATIFGMRLETQGGEFEGYIIK
ncbi:MAG: rhodanese-like domain-containing protein [Candidatus Nanoarchaeia archaeon]